MCQTKRRYFDGQNADSIDLHLNNIFILVFLCVCGTIRFKHQAMTHSCFYEIRFIGSLREYQKYVIVAHTYTSIVYIENICYVNHIKFQQIRIWSNIKMHLDWPPRYLESGAYICCGDRQNPSLMSIRIMGGLFNLLFLSDR